uniref:KIB1-4 beta-propeller domain-containing protein n=1 Tax=Oryza punctata TaxID=4537 RepID=A0A0E0KP14_ORYPU
MESAGGNSGVVLGGMPQTKSRLEIDAGVSLWAGLNPDILGDVLRFLPCLADLARCAVIGEPTQTVTSCHHPLPQLVLPDFKITSLTDKGDLMPVRRVPVPKEVAADELRCVGSFDGWLVGATPNKDRSDEYNRDADGECFLVNVFSRKVIRLPQLCSMSYNFSAYSRRTLSVINGSGHVHFCANDLYTLSLCQVVLSASPESSEYIVAGLSDHKGAPILALWQPGDDFMAVEIDGPRYLSFYQGKLYVLTRHRTRLFTCELVEDDRGFMVSRIECSLTELPRHHPYQEGGAISCNMVVWRGELLLIIRHNGDYLKRQLHKLEEFALDVATNPYGLTEIHSLNGDCIFVGLGGCKSFAAGLHHGVEGDLIYFVPDDWKPYDTFVYSMRDGKMSKTEAG